MLVEHGAINSTDTSGYKPMDLARKQNNEKKRTSYAGTMLSRVWRSMYRIITSNTRDKVFKRMDHDVTWTYTRH